MQCPKCGHQFANPISQAGGSRKVSKGFASPKVQAKAQATRKKHGWMRTKSGKPEEPQGV